MQKLHGAIVYRCNCERGYVRCYRQVTRRGAKCETCAPLAGANGWTGAHRDAHHIDGYHTATITTDARS